MKKKFSIISIIAMLLVVCGALTACGGSSDNNSKPAKPVLLGKKVVKSRVKSKDDGLYYVSKDNSKIRYFVDADKVVTAAKVVFLPDPMPTTEVQAYVSVILNDKNPLYGNDKESENNTLLKPALKYNVYSKKYKKWYHLSMQPYQGSTTKVAQFSIWPGKDDEAE